MNPAHPAEVRANWHRKKLPTIYAPKLIADFVEELVQEALSKGERTDVDEIINALLYIFVRNPARLKKRNPRFLKEYRLAFFQAKH